MCLCYSTKQEVFHYNSYVNYLISSVYSILMFKCKVSDQLMGSFRFSVCHLCPDKLVIGVCSTSFGFLHLSNFRSKFIRFYFCITNSGLCSLVFFSVRSIMSSPSSRPVEQRCVKWTQVKKVFIIKYAAHTDIKLYKIWKVWRSIKMYQKNRK